MEVAITVVLFGLLLVMAVVVGRQRSLFSAAMLTGIFSLLSAGLFTVMDAIDVAFTEAAVGAGISTVLILATLALTDHEERRGPRDGIDFKALGVVSLCGAALLYGTVDMPAFGTADAPVHTGVAKHFLDHSYEEIGLPNVVTSVLASYRGYDTFGELAVVFIAGLAVALLLGAGAPAITDESPTIAAKSRAPYVREMPIVRVVTKALLPFILLFALYVQAHGDFGPGGGFQAGVIFAAGLVLYGLVWGPAALEKFARHRVVERSMAIGLLLYGGVGVVTMLLGGNFLEYGVLTPEHPSHGQHYGIFLVELGVGITVSAVMLVIYYVFAARRSPNKSQPSPVTLPPPPMPAASAEEGGA